MPVTHSLQKHAYNKQLGKRLRRLREAHAWNLKEGAKRLGFTVQTLSNIEYGRRGLSCASLIRLATGYGTSTDAILGLTPMPTPPPSPDLSQTHSHTTTTSEPQGALAHA
jgi:transcriptional regulator with XRE-family HTH domain